MIMCRNRLRLLSSASAIAMAFSATTALSQDTDGEFLGEIELETGKRDIQTDTATPVTKINQEEIDDRQAGTVAELIDSVPGVSLVNGSTPQGSGINIRGFGANGTFGTDQKVLVIVDGATTGAEELYRIGNQLFTDPQLYKSVTVNRGTVGSFEYGSGVIGGAVILATKDASDFTGGEVGVRFRQVLEAASNGPGFVTSSTLAWQPTENFDLLLNYTLRDQDNQKDGTGAVIGNSKFRLPSYLIKAKYKFGDNLDHSITASYNSSRSTERDVPYDTFMTTAGSFGNVDRDIDTRVAGLHYRFQPVGNDLIDLSVNLTYSDQKIDSTYIFGSCSGFPGCDARVGPLANADHRYETTKLTAKNTAFFQTVAIRHDLRAGVELSRRERLDALAAPGGTDERIALFIVDDMDFGNGFSASPAVRYETQEITGSTAPNNGRFSNDALMGGLSLRYEFQSGFAVFGSAAYTESLPIIDDLGNPAFMTQPEKARTYELGASFANTDVITSGDFLRAKVNAYTTSVWDITSYSSARRPLSAINIDGIELEASYAMQNGLYVDLNANKVDGKETRATGVETRWRNAPADQVRVTLGKRFGDAWDLSWEFVGNRGVTDSNGARTPGFGINNLRATYRPQNGVWQGAEIRVGIENAFDHDYTPFLSTRPAPGRNVKLTLAKTF
ncbi:MAG: TonB-dependent receptor [Paracoccaceae bacterium]